MNDFFAAKVSGCETGRPRPAKAEAGLHASGAHEKLAKNYDTQK
jgi:hypothetical protein